MMKVSQFKEFLSTVPDDARIRFFYDWEKNSLFAHVDFLAPGKHVVSAFKVKLYGNPNFIDMEDPPKIDV